MTMIEDVIETGAVDEWRAAAGVPGTPDPLDAFDDLDLQLASLLSLASASGVVVISESAGKIRQVGSARFGRDGRWPALRPGRRRDGGAALRGEIGPLPLVVLDPGGRDVRAADLVTKEVRACSPYRQSQVEGPCRPTGIRPMIERDPRH
ncbi:hypothetical protein [Actinoallomurus sp. NPDC050550]|uniref:hypothetical protein n=1 Tax=Actinoallomurus sp. NPDC050550 TaxID=3154937 RepID=UPI0033F37CA6